MGNIADDVILALRITLLVDNVLCLSRIILCTLRHTLSAIDSTHSCCAFHRIWPNTPVCASMNLPTAAMESIENTLKCLDSLQDFDAVEPWFDSHYRHYKSTRSWSRVLTASCFCSLAMLLEGWFVAWRRWRWHGNFISWILVTNLRWRLRGIQALSRV